MNILWDHLPYSVEGLLSYDHDGGAVALLENGRFSAWQEAEKREGGGWSPLRAAWSALKEPAHWASVVKGLLEETNAKYPDAIVAYAWQGDLLAVFVARTVLIDEVNGYSPEWYETGKPPRPTWKIRGSSKRLLMHGMPGQCLWEIVDASSVRKGRLIWPQNGVYKIVHRMKGVIPWTDLTQVYSSEIETIEVLKPIEVFKEETVIIVNENGTWSPASIWVGGKLELAQ